MQTCKAGLSMFCTASSSTRPPRLWEMKEIEFAPANTRLQ